MFPAIAGIIGQVTDLLAHILEKWVTVTVVPDAITTNCYSADYVTASLTNCGEEFALGLQSVIASLIALAPKLLAGLGVIVS